MDWLDLLAVQGTLKSLLQHHSSQASIFQHSAFFTVQLSYPYMATGKTIASWSFSQWLPKAFCLSQRESVTVSSEVLWWESPTSIPAFSSLSVTVLRRTTRTRGCALGMILWTEEPFMALAQSRVHTHPAQQSLMPRRRKPLGVRGKHSHPQDALRTEAPSEPHRRVLERRPQPNKTHVWLCMVVHFLTGRRW